MSYDEYLQHHGILGMRWGRRNGPPYPLLRKNMSAAERNQNPVSASSSNEESKKVLPPKTVTVDTDTGTKTVSNNKPLQRMSDKELDQAIGRMKKEKEYRTLSSQDITKGSAWIKALLGVAGATAFATFAASAGKDIGNGVYGGTKSKVLDVIDLFKNGVFDEKKK